MITNEGVAIGCFFIWSLRNFVPLRKGLYDKAGLSRTGDFSANQKRFAELMKCP